MSADGKASATASHITLDYFKYLVVAIQREGGIDLCLSPLLVLVILGYSEPSICVSRNLN